MSATLFFQLVALIVIFHLVMLAACIAVAYMYHMYMPTMMQKLMSSFEDDESDLDQHFEDNRQIIDPIGENPFKN